MANENLTSAKKAKNDEFYTQYEDIEKEINGYLDLNPNVFRGKTILLPCDDPDWSNFTKYFAQNFAKLGLKKLISTSYAPNAKPDIPYQPALFEIKDEKFDEVKTRANGKIFTLTKDISGDGKVDFSDFEWEYLEGDGDFRSDEVIKLRNEADFVITNPPFSLFREFITWVMKSHKKFILVGNMNAITYKEIFPLIKDNKVWLGAGKNDGRNVWYRIPNSYDNHHKIEDGKKYAFVAGTIWFTNVDHGRRHEKLILMTEADNIKFSKHKEIKGKGYTKYDNYNAIEIPRVDSIPSDYKGVMGVPISFLSKYNPDQFEIIEITNKNTVPKYLLIEGQEKYDRGYVNGKRMYSRILIKHKTKSKKTK
jgi:hypothetical protein